MRFKLIDEAKKEFPVHRLCRILVTRVIQIEGIAFSV